MYSRQHNFEVKQLKYSTYHDSDYGVNGPGYCVDYFKDFAIGKQSRVSHTKNTSTTHYANVPATAWDWVKKLVIEFCPPLNFGWLTPTYRAIACKNKTIITNTFYNVIPVDPNKKYRDQYLITEVGWLTTTPYTNAEFLDAKLKVQELETQPKYCWHTPKQLAAIAVYKSFEED